MSASPEGGPGGAAPGPGSDPYLAAALGGEVPATRLSVLQRAALRVCLTGGCLGVLVLVTLLAQPGRLLSNKGLGLLIAASSIGGVHAAWFLIGVLAGGLRSPARGLAAALGGAGAGLIGFVLVVLNAGWAAGNVTQGSFERGWAGMLRSGQALLAEPTRDLLELSFLVTAYPALVLWLRVSRRSVEVQAVTLLLLAGLHYGLVLALGLDHAPMGPLIGVLLAGTGLGAGPMIEAFEGRCWPALAVSPQGEDEASEGSAPAS